MNCVSSRQLLGAYLDQELEPGLQTEIQSHLTACHACSDVYAKLRDQQADIRSHAPHYQVPTALLESVRSTLEREAANEIKAASKTNSSWGWGWAAIAASILLCISAGWNVVMMRSSKAAPDVLTENLLSSHVSSLIGTHLLDVPSSDQHTVKPWFDGKLDFSPDVKNLTSQGFPLLGGRIEYISERPVAALVFGRRKHIINLFTWPTTATPGASRWSRQGYNMVHWTKGGMAYFAISDITFDELQQFRDLYEM